MTILLEVESLTKSFGGVAAIDHVSFNLPAGIVLGLIGPNGSGKTTLLNTINGAYKPENGSVHFMKVKTTGLAAHKIAGLGIARTFQDTRVFDTITAYQNMTVPMLHRRISPHELRTKALELLDSVGLLAFADTPASELSGGQRKLLEFARAFMIDPKILLMDEPFAGVHPEIIAIMTERIRDYLMSGKSMIVVSHEILVIMELSHQVICMDSGKVIAHDTPEKVSEDERVVRAYLGHSGGSK
jgi:ABC-type branched-subunit amino acid transport system ATPase component